MATQDRQITQAVEPDGGLEGHFIEATVRVLAGVGIAARHDFPGCLFFDALGREWATAYTGLHVNDNEGYGDGFPGDERLVALESRGTLSVGEYADALLAVIDDARRPASSRTTSTDPEHAELASDLKALGINLRDLQVRIETAADLEPLALTDARLQEIEAVRAAVAALEDVITRARNRAVSKAVAARWPYKRIQRATGLSISRIGQIAPARAGRDPDAEPTIPNPNVRRRK